MSQMVRPVETSDREEWQALYQAYADSYKVEMTDEKFDTVWSWLHDPAHVLNGAVLVQHGRLVGLMHYRRMPAPLRAKDICFLDDLFVAPLARGQRSGEALLTALQEFCRDEGWEIVRWNTAEDNYRAKTLYDRVAQKTHWHVYEMEGSDAFS